MIPFFPPKHVIIICSPLYLPFHSLPSRSMFDPSSIGFRRVVIDQVCQALCETLTLRESAGHRPWVRGWMVCFTSCASSRCVQCEAPKIAFSWFITPISLWFMVFITIDPYNYRWMISWQSFAARWPGGPILRSPQKTDTMLVPLVRRS